MRRLHNETTRARILDTAERLFAERGLHAVSNRQVSAAAGQGNNAAVGYHFGTKHDLVRAIVRRHGLPVEALRADMVARAGDSPVLRDWVDCLVRPVTAHLADLAARADVVAPGGITWYARFVAQVVTDPALRLVAAAEVMTTPGMGVVLERLRAHLPPEVAPEVRFGRERMVWHLIVQVCAERERALAEGVATPRDTWDGAARGLVDAITGLWTAPDNTVGERVGRG
ncbi:TetR family transcriptional regulator [Actinosynnema pretiosum subsp. pretiosum]|uniref:Transcriptional regulator, TetR family n=2 Tax=Actinosynnema TaxID=40566 RepID=C6WQG2_ACTMD|nr:TetR family transcriptional regulator [Actinosynnema mirum]ACU36816.1 transcriptional regulator, TetR family [Actinosynnema mirum DSM 43827]AXX30279.1 Transcriptional regulator, TetR family [Actinosynnema pretiosum subsp. pretiosum]QUF05564.1 TetR family transcriptional regulator [Actinosynnema pretiosum subsp. pretiosum]